MDKLLRSIEANNGKLQKLLKNRQVKKSLYDWLLTELAYTSNFIEGNTLTRKETALAINENITAGAKPIKDYLGAKNHAEAFRLVLELASSKAAVTENDILNIHKLILQGIDTNNGGVYRNVRVRIAGSDVVLPNPLKVPQLMKEFLKSLRSGGHNITSAIKAHYDLVSIHPFADGNGRTARLLMNLLLLKSGYQSVIIRPRDRRIYINVIERTQLKGDMEFYDSFMLHALNRSIETYLDFFDNSRIKDNAGDLITVSQFARAAKLPVSTVRYYLRTGKLKPVAKTQSDYMLFSEEQAQKFKKAK